MALRDWLARSEKNNSIPVATAIPAIPAIPNSNIIDIGIERLRRASRGTGLNMGELVEWYGKDLPSFADEPDETVKACVLDYKRHRASYRTKN